jgi:hypothetical protein
MEAGGTVRISGIIIIYNFKALPVDTKKYTGDYKQNNFQLPTECSKKNW